MEKGGKCVSILRTITDGEECRIELDEEALKSVFEQVGNLPVMLLSVSGAFRKGKSFMLNFFLRYLKNQGYIPGDWLGNEAVGDSFPWKGGKLPYTQGVLIYSEPFILEVNGRETAVFLMDTQGLFDNNSDKKLCTQIFAFSTLLSSVQVFNLSQQIQENDLECLQCFTKYAHMAQRTDTYQGPPFQKLVFVVRDWQQVEDHDYGLDLTQTNDGEVGYLESVLSCTSDNEELTTVRKHLRESFSDLECFLLPHPGRKVALAGKKIEFRGEIKDINEDFVNEIQSLSDFLLNPKNCVQKKIYGNIITANSLVNYAIACGRAFHDGGLPEPQTMLKECSQYMPDDSIALVFRKAQDQVLSIFDVNVRYGEISNREKTRANLLLRMRMHFEMIESQNQARATEIQTSVRERGDHFVKEYAAKMDEATGNRILSEDKFKATHEKYYQEALNAFTDENQGKLGFQTALQIIEGDFNFAFQTLKRQNSEKQRYYAVKLEGNNRKLQGIVSQCTESYRIELLKLLSKYSENAIVKRKHRDFTDSAVKSLRSLAKGMPENVIQENETLLRSKIEKEFAAAQPKIDQKRKILLMTLDGRKSEMVSVYLAMMSENIGDSYVLPEVLEHHHRREVEELADAMRTFDQIEEVCWDAECNPTVLRCVDELKIQLEEKYQNIQENNEKNRKLYMKTKTSGFKKFFSKMFGSS